MQTDDDVRRTRQARKAGIAALFGSSIEWYDFFIYGTASALVFGKLFFPLVDPAVGVIASFATFWVGFLARPLGGAIFGHLGDRIGRKRTLIVTLLLMGTATVCVGLLPTYAEVGLAAPALLVALRALQGIAVGGEWGGAVLIAAEHAGADKRVAAGGWAQQGSPIGGILSTIAFIVATDVSGDAFLAWGWRIPFLASAVLVLVALAVRLSVTEPPEFVQARATAERVKLPVVEVFRKHGVLVVLGIGASATGIASAYFANVFMLSWATGKVGIPEQAMLDILLWTAISQFFAQIIGVALSRRITPSRVMIAALIGAAIVAPLNYAAVGTGSPAIALAMLVVGVVPSSIYYALLAGFLADVFPVSVRYSGISMSYQLCATLIGGTAPLIAQALLTSTGSIVPVAAYEATLALVTMTCVFLLARRTRAARRTATALTAA